MEQLVRERKTKALIVVAPPRMLADLRQALHADVKHPNAGLAPGAGGDFLRDRCCHARRGDIWSRANSLG